MLSILVILLLKISCSPTASIGAMISILALWAGSPQINTWTRAFNGNHCLNGLRHYINAALGGTLTILPSIQDSIYYLVWPTSTPPPFFFLLRKKKYSIYVAIISHQSHWIWTCEIRKLRYHMYLTCLKYAPNLMKIKRTSKINYAH